MALEVGDIVVTEPAAESVIESVDAVLARYFRDQATVAHVHAALLWEWQDMQRPGSHGPAMLSVTKWAVRNAARNAECQLDEQIWHLLLEPLGGFFTRE